MTKLNKGRKRKWGALRGVFFNFYILNQRPQVQVGLSTVPVYTGIRAAVIQVPSPSRLALKERFDRMVDGPVTPRIRPSRYGHNRPYHGRMMGMLTPGVSTVTATFCSAPSSCVPLALRYHVLHLQGPAHGRPSQGRILPVSQGIPSSVVSRGEYPQVSFSDRSLGLPPSVGPTSSVPLARSHSF